MVMQSLRTGASGGFLKYILLGLLGMAVAGLVLMDFNNSFTGGFSNREVAKIEGHSLDIAAFDATLRRSIQQYGVTPQQAYQYGLLQEVLFGEVNKILLNVEAQKLGVNFGRDLISERIAQVVKPQMQDGETLQQALDRLLGNLRLSEQDFMRGIEQEVTTDLLMAAVQENTVFQNDLLTQDLYTFQNQSRDLEMLFFADEAVTDYEDPDDKKIEDLYAALKDQNYKIPEFRAAQIAVIDPNDLAADIDVSDEDIQAYYDNNQEQYGVGEQFVVSQVMIKDEAKAQEIFALTEKGEDLRSAAVQVLGDDKKFYPEISFEIDMMLAELKDALADREIGKIVAPVKTMLGYHVVRLEKILEPSVKPFSDVRDVIKHTLTTEKKADLIYDMISELEDRLFNGEELSVIFDGDDKAALIQTSLMDQAGLDQNGEVALLDIEEQDRPLLQESLFLIGSEDDPFFAEEMPSGKFVFMTVTDVQEESFQDLAEVKDDIRAQFISDQQHANNLQQANKHATEIKAGGTTLEKIAEERNIYLKKIDALNIQTSEWPEPLTQSARATLFSAAVNDVEVIDVDGGIALVRIAGFDLPDTNGESVQGKLDSIKAELEKELKEEAFVVYLKSLRAKYDVDINTAILDRYYGPGSE